MSEYRPGAPGADALTTRPRAVASLRNADEQPLSNADPRSSRGLPTPTGPVINGSEHRSLRALPRAETEARARDRADESRQPRVPRGRRSPGRRPGAGPARFLLRARPERPAEGRTRGCAPLQARR